MAKFRSQQEIAYNDDEVYIKNTKRKSNQYNKCKNYDCEENDNGFCSRHKNKAKEICKNFE